MATDPIHQFEIHNLLTLGHVGGHSGGKGEDAGYPGSGGESADLAGFVADGVVGHFVENLDSDARRSGGLFNRSSDVILGAVASQRTSQIRLPVDTHTRKLCCAHQHYGEARLGVLDLFALFHGRNLQ